jgi:hypothetical protein
MDEVTWLTTTDPEAMLVHLRTNGPEPSDRRMRLFLCACCRYFRDSLHNEAVWEAVSAAEQYADGKDDGAALERAVGGAVEALAAVEQGDRTTAQLAGLLALAAAVPPSSGRDPWTTLTEFREGIAARVTAEHRSVAANLLREVVGNPFRPVTVDPSWLRWQNGLVAKMAWSIYDGRHFAELPVLADALEDAGCGATDILAHLHAPGPHVLGCWALDALLGKG